MAAAVLERAAGLGVTPPEDLRLWELAGIELRDDPILRPKPSRAGREPEGLAGVLEAATPASARRVNGLHVTPDWLADHLVELALTDLAVDPAELTVCDPACGGGAFLLAAARALHARGVARQHVARHLLWGADIDPVGLATAEAALALWAGEPPPPAHLVVGDALMDGARVWPQLPDEGFAAVVGNPPFLNQLERATVRSRAAGPRLRARFGPAVRPYTDTAWLFLLVGVELARAGGRVALVQPLSVVGARDAEAVRTALARRASLQQLWLEPRRVFAASVQVCAPVLDVCSDPATGAVDWGERLADAMGIPPVAMPGSAESGRLGDLAEVLGGFRDEYYGLVPLVREARPSDAPPGARPLVTSGVLDWGRSAWGQRPTRFAKRRWTAPVVDQARAADDDSAPARGGARWLRRVAVPKVVVATQTRVVEAAVDESGAWVPSVPVLAVLPRQQEDLWRLAAAIAAPAATAWLFRRAPGTALSRGALKIAARDLAALPLPRDSGAWDAATVALRRYTQSPEDAVFESFVVAATAAYGAEPEVVGWWRERLGR